ncbi:hypothetical protein D3C74_27120 [compost metagenome]
MSTGYASEQKHRCSCSSERCYELGEWTGMLLGSCEHIEYLSLLVEWVHLSFVADKIKQWAL